ncbi:hypothetical protein DI09_584p10, partial [Mitosporidium daphniae]
GGGRCAADSAADAHDAQANAQGGEDGTKGGEQRRCLDCADGQDGGARRWGAWSGDGCAAGHRRLCDLVGAEELFDRGLQLAALEARGHAQVLGGGQLDGAAVGHDDGGFGVAGDQHGVACVQGGAGGGFVDEVAAADADVARHAAQLSHGGFFGVDHAGAGQNGAQGGECKCVFHG